VCALQTVPLDGEGRIEQSLEQQTVEEREHQSARVLTRLIGSKAQRGGDCRTATAKPGGERLPDPAIVLRLYQRADEVVCHRERFVQGYVRVGVPEDKLDYLAIILLTGAAGLMLGLVWAPIGVAAAGGVTLYFLVAIGFHIRAHDTEHLPTPLVIAVLAAAALALRLAGPVVPSA
jgi:DoxX-like family